MNRDQYHNVANIKPDLSLHLERDYARPTGIPATDQRTLLYGYNVDRETFHVYMQGGEIHAILYDARRNLLDYQHGIYFGDASALSPNKRVYPERTDYQFARLLKSKGVHVSFTNWSSADYGGPAPTVRGYFHGLTRQDFPVDFPVDSPA